MFREGFFETVEPVCLMTLATPHLGARDAPGTTSGRAKNGGCL
jgi:hypothetical protein